MIQDHLISENHLSFKPQCTPENSPIVILFFALWIDGLLISLFDISMAGIFYAWCLQMIGFVGNDPSWTVREPVKLAGSPPMKEGIIDLLRRCLLKSKSFKPLWTAIRNQNKAIRRISVA